MRLVIAFFLVFFSALTCAQQSATPAQDKPAAASATLPGQSTDTIACKRACKKTNNDCVSKAMAAKQDPEACYGAMRACVNECK